MMDTGMGFFAFFAASDRLVTQEFSSERSLHGIGATDSSQLRTKTDSSKLNPSMLPCKLAHPPAKFTQRRGLDRHAQT